ncbi:LysR family transcriptional regulator ArgP [Leucobacter albus]|uniref:LysR family transcriptional regulator ArgP n=1 Tax=Leucobacter albus TaxID=272210 RepID=A0ABW3TLI3_9MICO
MDLPLEHLRTFAAVVDSGSLEAAAKLLHISPSAVSQRLRSMEERIGAVLLRRTRPVAVTEAGATVLRAARQLAQIVEDVAAEFDQRTERGSLVRLVINADSLATWFVPALARAASETGARFEVLRADETISTEKLRSGEVMAALTATSEPVPGCVSTLLGVDQYHAVAAPEFHRAHFGRGVTAAALMSAPMVEFDRFDMFQQRFISECVRAESGAATATAPTTAPQGSTGPPRNFVPSSAEFALAVELGMGWGMLPRLQCAEALRRGTLVELIPGRSLPLPLYWQRWDLRSPVLDALSEIVAQEAERALSPTSVEYAARL